MSTRTAVLAVAILLTGVAATAAPVSLGRGGAAAYADPLGAPFLIVGFDPQPEPPGFEDGVWLSIANAAVTSVVAAVIVSPSGGSFGVEFLSDSGERLFFARISFDPQPEPPGFTAKHFDPQPEPPGFVSKLFDPQPEPPGFGIHFWLPLDDLSAGDATTMRLQLYEGDDEIALTETNRIPEPASVQLLALGLAGAIAARRNRRA